MFQTATLIVLTEFRHLVSGMTKLELCGYCRRGMVFIAVFSRLDTVHECHGLEGRI